MPRPSRSLGALAFLVSTVVAEIPAQKTWTVNARGGADFTTIKAAVAASRAGDTLLVAPTGVYGEFTVIDKGISIVPSGPGAITTGTIYVERIPAGESVLLDGVAVSWGNFVRVRDCTGRVQLVRCRSEGRAPIATLPSARGLVIENCELVTFHAGVTSGSPAGVGITNSAAYFSDSTLLGTVGGQFFRQQWAASPGLACSQKSLVLISRCTFRGGDEASNVRLTPSPALVIVDSTLMIAGRSALSAGKAKSAFVVSAIQISNSNLTLDPNATLTSTNTMRDVVGSGTVNRVSTPTLRASASASRVVDTTLEARAGTIAGLFIGSPSKPLPIAQVGIFWLDQAQPLILADIGPLNAIGVRKVRVSFPPSVPQSLAIAFQCLTLDPSTGLGASTPVTLNLLR